MNIRNRAPQSVLELRGAHQFLFRRGENRGQTFHLIRIRPGRGKPVLTRSQYRGDPVELADDVGSGEPGI